MLAAIDRPIYDHPAGACLCILTDRPGETGNSIDIELRSIDLD